MESTGLARFLFELASDERLGSLEAIEEKPLRHAQIARRLKITDSETTRHLNYREIDDIEECGRDDHREDQPCVGNEGGPRTNYRFRVARNVLMPPDFCQRSSLPVTRFRPSEASVVHESAAGPFRRP